MAEPATTTSPSRRDRLRTELVAEIKRLAMGSIAETGAGALSLRSIARGLGVAPSALYRYFPSRDALLGVLIADAYDALGAEVEAAVRAVHAAHPFDRWMAACHATRAWGLAEPNRWALIYGTPIPGYQPDPDIVLDPAMRITNALTDILVGAVEAGSVDHAALEAAAAGTDPALLADLDAFVERFGVAVPPALMAQGIAAWSQLIGIVSFEVFGHLEPVVTARDALFERQAVALGLGFSLTNGS